MHQNDKKWQKAQTQKRELVGDGEHLPGHGQAW
jgi:hypothetical protein